MFSPNRMLPYSRQLIEQDDVSAVVKVLQSDFLTQGPKVREFEQALADYGGAEYAVVFNTGTAALHSAYFAAGITSGDEIITSPITFAATANAALYLGARPSFVDIETETGNINPDLIEERITKKTKALVPVHYGGHPVDLDQIHQIAQKYGLLVIEDACHALGTRYKGRKIGAFSDLTVFSFHPVKPLTTGEGGAILTNNEEFYKRLKLFREHGITKSPELLTNKTEGGWYYEMHHLGFNYRITDIQCALGISQLKKLARFIKMRRDIVRFYQESLAGISEIRLPREREYAYSSWHLFPIQLKAELVQRKKEIFRQLRARKIWVQVHYIPVYWHPYYERLGYEKGICPVAEDFYHREISLPVFQGMTNEEAKFVSRTLIECVEGEGK